MKPSSKRKPLLEGGGAMRAAILQVCRAVECDGRRTGEILIKFGSEAGGQWGTVADDDLMQNKVTALTALAVVHDVDSSDLDEAGLKILGRQIRAAAKDRVVRLQHTGHFRVTAGGAEAEGFVFGGQIYWANDHRHPIDVVYLADHPPIEPSCSLQVWKEKVGSLFGRQRYMIVALGASLAALLVRPTDISKLSLHVVGESSTGKGALQRACLSICRTGDALEAASGTALGLQMRMTDYPDEPWFLEDTQLLGDPAGLMKLGYDVGNGAFRVVGSATQKAVVGTAAHCTLIASGERTVAETAVGRSVQIDAGYGARVFELVVTAEHGVFDALGDGMDAATFAELLETRSRRYYGAVWPAWVAAVARDLARVKARKDRWMPKIRERLESAISGEDRVLKRMIAGYAGWLFALILAIDYKLIPLKKGEVIEAFRSVLIEQQEMRGTGRTQQQEDILDAVRFALDRNRQSFVPWEDRHRPVNGLWGYTRMLDGVNFYLLLPKMLDMISQNYGRRDTLRALETAGLLEMNHGAKTYSARLPPAGDPKRFYAINARIHGDG